MDYRRKIFTYHNLYDLKNTDEWFLRAVKQNIEFHRDNCADYRRILKQMEFQPENLHTIDDLYEIPAIPTLYFKSHELYSVPKNKLRIQVTSSGTNGMQSHIGFDRKTLFYALRMALRTFACCHLISGVPTNYIVLGYEPNKENQMGAVKTAYGATLLAPALHREYALKDTGGKYELNLEGVLRTLVRYSKMRFPVRFIGFPAYMLFLLRTLESRNIKMKLPAKSKVFLAGGWKQFFAEQVDKTELYRMIEERLGIPETGCKEFFGAVEHPVLYCDCKNHHFHVPVYSRILIRDVKTLRPVANGTVGLLSLITPLVGSVPLVHVITDDLAVMHSGKECGCGIESPYFELLGRAGLRNVKTCAASASELLGKTPPQRTDSKMPEALSKPSANGRAALFRG